MDEVELLRVFERYYQADKKKDGKGIGLAIVKEFCDSNFITIDISSTKYQGTTIKLLFDDIATIKSY
jgi:signal transduction histidine kinase